jgi:hypothetical protein
MSPSPLPLVPPPLVPPPLVPPPLVPPPLVPLPPSLTQTQSLLRKLNL